MGFDQYHEPPDEPPADARTFARLCASLTEEAGLYLEERFSFRVATDEAAVALVNPPS
jgi:uncharacterized protein